MNYEEEMAIDAEALDVEWLEQPRLMLKITRMQAQLQKEEDLAKEELELVQSEIDLDIRANPEKYNLPKATDASVSAAIPTAKRYKEATKKYIEAKFENNTAKGAVRSCDQRKTSLENLVQLHGQKYFAGPKVPRDLTYEVQEKEKQKRTDAGVASRIHRTRTL